MVDSASTDNGPELLEKALRIKGLPKTKIRSIRLGTTTPSSSKNLGVLQARCPWVAFMDCGQNFSRFWLQQQWVLTRAKPRRDVVYGSCRLKGKGVIDACAVAQSYGYSKLVATIPGSIIRKNLFKKVGFFPHNRRAGYDVAWRQRVKKMGIQSRFPTKPCIAYESHAHACGFLPLLRKNFSYSRATVGLQSFWKELAYPGLFILLGGLVWWRPALFLYIAVIYFLLRGYAWPALRSSKILELYKKFPLSIAVLPWAAFVIDLGRLSGVFAGYIFGKEVEHKFSYAEIQDE